MILKENVFNFTHKFSVYRESEVFVDLKVTDSQRWKIFIRSQCKRECEKWSFKVGYELKVIKGQKKFESYINCWWTDLKM